MLSAPAAKAVAAPAVKKVPTAKSNKRTRFAVSASDLTPNMPANVDTFAVATAGNEEVGYYQDGDLDDMHALLWTGTAASEVNLEPTAPGPLIYFSQAFGTNGTQQATFVAIFAAITAALADGPAAALAPETLLSFSAANCAFPQTALVNWRDLAGKSPLRYAGLMVWFRQFTGALLLSMMMMSVQRRAQATFPATEPTAASLAWTSDDPKLVQGRQWIKQGKFSETERLLSEPDVGTDAVTLEARKQMLEIIRRIRIDYSYSAQDVVDAAKDQLPGITLEMVQRWQKAGEVQSRLIDGKVCYFSSEPSNLLRFCEPSQGDAATSPGDRADKPMDVAGSPPACCRRSGKARLSLRAARAPHTEIHADGASHRSRE